MKTSKTGKKRSPWLRSLIDALIDTEHNIQKSYRKDTGSWLFEAEVRELRNLFKDPMLILIIKVKARLIRSVLVF